MPFRQILKSFRLKNFRRPAKRVRWSSAVLPLGSPRLPGSLRVVEAGPRVPATRTLNDADWKKLEALCSAFGTVAGKSVLDLGSPGGLAAVHALRFYAARGATYAEADWNEVEEAVVHAAENFAGQPKQRASLAFHVSEAELPDVQLARRHEVIAKVLHDEDELHALPRFEALLRWYAAALGAGDKAPELIVLVAHRPLLDAEVISALASGVASSIGAQLEGKLADGLAATLLHFKPKAVSARAA